MKVAEAYLVFCYNYDIRKTRKRNKKGGTNL